MGRGQRRKGQWIVEVRDAEVYGKRRRHMSSKKKDSEFRMVVCSEEGMSWAGMEEKDLL